ncbi:MAG: glycoside hydrolase family 2 TIM barrel-domain containing protein [Opitutaceae bacterium]|jgi:beta-glucuronidase
MSTSALIRPIIDLNGLWDFSFLGAFDPAEFSPASFAPADLMPVPAAFDALTPYAGKRGLAVYRRFVEVPSGQPAKIVFGAVSIWARVFVDGRAVADHGCGYAPFEVDIAPSGSSRREVLVLVDNRFNRERAPMHEEFFDFYQHGGIIRDVHLHVLPAAGAWIDSIHVLPTSSYRDGSVEVSVRFRGQVGGSARLMVSFDGGAWQTLRDHAVRDDQVVFSATVPDAHLWTLETPRLHTVSVTLLDPSGVKTDAMQARFGLRRIEARAGALWLNGKKLVLRGYNRHEWHPNFGPSTPVLQMASDLRLLRDLGCNFVRGSHYPQDQRFLDLCDELGMLVWEENLGWGQHAATFALPKFQADHAAAMRAMVRASFNHPCVIIWGFLNETETDTDAVRPIMEESVRLLRSLDPSRLISYASRVALTDRHYDLVDLIAINIYPGWYDCEGVENPLSLIRPHMHACFAHIDRAGFADKPVIVGEIGAEALYGWRDPHDDFFSEEHQARYLSEAISSALEHPRCSGIALWHFSDVRTYGGGRSLRRPRTFNNKGTLDEYRRPKAAYAAVKALFQAHAAGQGKPRPAN